ncbi:MAG: DUF4105 domain-containing protein [Myxococcales bacterium]|nr:DUF4105 domain-containing protein [Myxococcales bacterium]
MPGLSTGASLLVPLIASAAIAQVDATALAARRIVLVPSSGWTPEVLEDLSLGLDALPPRARAFPGGPLEVELHDEARAFGIGEAGTRLHLFEYRDDDDPRAMAQLSRLSVEQRRRLWRRRAVVHAIIRRWDSRLHWSDRPAWRRIAGWRDDEPFVQYAWAFSRREGQRSAALDLATFAEEALVPAESMDPHAVPPDARVRCRELTKSRQLDAFLRALDDSWTPGSSCPAFQRWATSSPVRGFELVFAAPSSVASQALFGHLLLRIVREGEDAAPGGGQVLQLAALVSPLEPRTSYVWKGLGLGDGFRGVFTLTTVSDVRAEALDLQQRSLRRFALELTPDQRERLLARIWELERIGYVDYRFFTANCSTMVRFLLEPVLDDAAPGPPSTPWEAPGQVLDSLAPLLRAMPADPASGEVARLAEATLEAELSRPGVKAALGARWPVVAGLAGDAKERVAAWAALETPLSPELEGWRARVALAGLRRERFGFDVATAERLRAEKQTILPGWKGPSTDELVASRQRRFEQAPSRRANAAWELAELLALDELLRTAPRREPDESEKHIIATAREAQRTFDAVANVVASLPEDALRRAQADEKEQLAHVQSETLARSVPEGGLGHASLAVGALSTGVPMLQVRVAALAEEQGDQRLGGFGSQVGVRALDATADLVASQGPSIARAGVTLLGVRVLSTARAGWGASLDYGYAQRAHEATVGGEGVVAVVRDERLTNFLLVAGGVRVGSRDAAFLIAPKVELGARVQLPGSFANAVRLEAGWTPRFLADASSSSFQHGVTGRARLVLRLGVVRGLAISARADVEFEWRPGSEPAGAAVAGLTFD